jgi:hypothetical protein
MADDLSKSSGDTPLDVEELRARLKNMTDSELRRFGRAVRLRPECVTQLEEARAEFRRRATDRKSKAYTRGPR